MMDHSVTIDSFKVRNGIGFTPSKANVINGWSIGWLMLSGFQEKDKVETINGIYTNLSPLQVFWGMMMIPRLVLTPFTLNRAQLAISIIDTTIINYNTINGVAFSVVDASEIYIVNGLQVSILMHELYKLQGVSAALGSSNYYSFNGVMISGVANITNRGKGLQIGLFNTSSRLNGVQIGLWNRIGNIGFPFINMCFRRER